MTEAGYLSTSQRHPVSLGLSVALTGAGLTVLLLVKPMVQQILPKARLEAREIAITMAPPPVRLKQTKLKPTPLAKQPVPFVDTDHSSPDASRTQIADSGSFPGLDLGNSSMIKIDPALPPEPVLTDASFDPHFASAMQLPYPPSLQRMEIEGTVTVRVQIGIDGRVLRVESAANDNEAFLNATREWALRHWRFKPATRDGIAAISWKTMKVRFQMTR